MGKPKILHKIKINWHIPQNKTDWIQQSSQKAGVK